MVDADDTQMIDAPPASGASPECAGPAPSRVRLLLGTIWPSFRRTAAALFSALGLPLFLLAAVSAAKYFEANDLLTVNRLAKTLLREHQSVLEALAAMAAQFGARLPAMLIEVAIAYLSVGNTVHRAEKDDLIAVQNDDSERWELLKEALAHGRVDSLTLAIPRTLRGLFVRVAWPLMALYRLKTPFVVEGPGPDDDPISSSVPRKELLEFAAMVHEARGWKGQRVHDFRQIIFWHFAFVAAAGFVGATVLSMVS